MENFGFFGDIEHTLEKNGKEKEKTYTYDEAIASIGTGKFHVWHFMVSGLSVMAVVIETVNVGLLMPIAKCELGFTASEQGLLASAGFLGVVLSSHMWGFLSDTWGRHKVLQISTTVASIFTVISAFSISVWMLAIFRFFVCFAISGCQACSYSYLGEFHGPKTRPKYIAYVSTFLPLGITYLPALAVGILPLQFSADIIGLKFTSWRLFILLGSIPTYISMISLHFLPESPKYLLIQGKHDKAIEVLQRCFKMNLNRAIEKYPVKRVTIVETGSSLSNVHGIKDGLKLIWDQTVPIFYKSRVLMTMNLIFLMFMIFFVAHGVFMWIPTLMATMVRNMQPNMTFCESIQTHNVSAVPGMAHNSCASAVDLLTFELIICMGVAYTICYILIGFLINRVGKKRLLIIWMMTVGLGTVALYWAEGLYLTFVLILVALAIGNCGGIVSTIAIDLYPTNINAMAFCFIMMSGRFGAVVGSNVVAIILEYDCNIMFLSMGIYILIGALLSFFLPVKSSDKKCIDVIT